MYSFLFTFDVRDKAGNPQKIKCAIVGGSPAS